MNMKKCQRNARMLHIFYLEIIYVFLNSTISRRGVYCLQNCVCMQFFKLKNNKPQKPLSYQISPNLISSKTISQLFLIQSLKF